MSVDLGGLVRSYWLYIPTGLRANAPLLIAFHGSDQDGAGMRVSTGFAFDRLADREGFLVAYPDGYKGNWNDCRLAASYPARHESIDDLGFTAELINQAHKRFTISPEQVFAVGYSNGGHFAFRLAFERPDLVAGIGAFAANLPAPSNSSCVGPSKALPVILVNGTDDPINPVEGGDVGFWGMSKRGLVISAQASASYFARIAGYTRSERVQSFPASGHANEPWPELFQWQDARTAGVELGAHPRWWA